MNVKKCAFLDVMGNIKEVPFFGRQMDHIVFPICLFVMVAITVGDLYNRILGCCKKNTTYVASGEYERNEKVNEGQFIVDKYRREKFSSRFGTASKK